ncbi:MAG: fasciclin domain-containing protein, partial [Thermoanaerobaculia bacterium]|nr:fasciclin domain-containing protein [Thermoanaerobaculia bacterium]
MKQAPRVTALAAAALVVTGLAHAGSQPATVVEVAVSAGSFQTLVKALQAAGLVETLQGDGPFTVFAPTDEA